VARFRDSNVKYRSWNDELNRYMYWEDGIYSRCGIDIDMFTIGYFKWNNAQSYIFTNKFKQEVYVGDVLEGEISGSKVRIEIRKDYFGIPIAVCTEYNSKKKIDRFNINNVELLFLYGLKVVESKNGI